jgi:hypothetical protein
VQRQAEGIARLEEGLPNRTPAQVAFHNLLVTRQVRLCDVLGTGPQGLRLVAAGNDWDASILLAVEGAGGTLAELGVSHPLVQALGIRLDLPPPLLHAVAGQLLSPVLPALRVFFNQDVSIRILQREPGPLETNGWVNFRLFFSTWRVDEPCRVHEAYLPLLHARALALPCRYLREVPVPLFLGEQLLLRPAELMALQAGDVVLSQHPDPKSWGLFTEPRRANQPSQCLAVMDKGDGRVAHLPSGPWRMSPRPVAAAGELRVAVEVIAARLALTAEQCRGLARGQALPGWAEVKRLARPELRIGTRMLWHTKAVRVSQRWGYELEAPSEGPSLSSAAMAGVS